MKQSLLLRRPFATVLTLVLVTVSSAAAQQTERRLNVAFVVWDGMELIESMGPAHVFSFAPGMDEYTVSAATAPIKSEFVTIVPQYTFADCPNPDVIVLPGGSIWIPRKDRAYGDWLRKHVPQATLTVSVCNSAILLADLGLLDGKEATCGNSNLDDLMLLGRDVKAYVNRRWVHSGNIITSKSYLGGLDAAIYAVRVLRGTEGEQQVLRWSNYDGDLSKYDAMQAEPGIVPISRRREICSILMKDGLDAAVTRYRQWADSGEIAYTPPLDQFSEPDMFQWMAWGNQRLGRHDISLKICEFKVRIWPDSARERAYLGEALMKAGRLKEALARLLEALTIEEGNRPALKFTKELLASRDLGASDDSRRARMILRKQAVSNQGVLGAADEPGIPLQVSGTVNDAHGHPIAGALLHVFQADSEGNYTPTDAMDESNARLFTYLRTDNDGRFGFRTVRPGYSPGTADLPQHLHLALEAAGLEPRRTQLYFDDDPRVNEARRSWIRQHGYRVLHVERTKDGTMHCVCDIELQATGQ